MSRCCGLAGMQHPACRATASQEWRTLERNSKTPSSAAGARKLFRFHVAVGIARV